MAGWAAIASSTGRLNARLLPLAVPVVTTTCSPRRAASHVSAWCRQSAVTPRATSADARRGSRSSGNGSARPSRAGSTVRWASSSASRMPAHGAVAVAMPPIEAGPGSAQLAAVRSGAARAAARKSQRTSAARSERDRARSAACPSLDGRRPCHPRTRRREGRPPTRSRARCAIVEARASRSAAARRPKPAITSQARRRGRCASVSRSTQSRFAAIDAHSSTAC